MTAKPVLIYDGDCNFCRRWIARWRLLTRDRVDYLAAQNRGDRFSDILPERLKSAVVLAETNGSYYDAAEAVFRVLAYEPSRQWILALYRYFFPFRWISDSFYRLIARRRVAFSQITHLLWGNHLEVPEYRIGSWLFLRILGAIYFIAFYSFWIQAQGLIGSHGIMPASIFLQAAKIHYGAAAYWELPTLGWLNSSDGFLNFICLGGLAASLLLFLGVLPILSSFVAWTFYLSLTILGQVFTSFQWDVLLLEAGFLAIFLSPWRVLDSLRRFQTSRLVTGLFQWLLFRLMFRSGVTKLASHDLSWRNLEAMNVHYETQPLPTWIGWYFHQLPEWFHRMSTVGVFAIELVLPFFIFFPRRLRLIACAGFLFFQMLIILTGNYCFFNLLAMAFCLFLVDDNTWPAFLKKLAAHPIPDAQSQSVRLWPGWILKPVFWILILASIPQLLLVFGKHQPSIKVLNRLDNNLSSFHIVNSYGLFAVMTTKRREIVLEGSNDRLDWKPYEFKWKPGALDRRPAFVAPHQPRLDWQMWFAALDSLEHHPWLLNLMAKMLRQEPTVLALLATNPFPDQPPTFLRAVIYDYHFTSFADRQRTGEWWQRSQQTLYAPVLTREGGKIKIVS